jgi:hypothetical protein
MKKFFLFLVLGISLAACDSADKKSAGEVSAPSESTLISAPADVTSIDWIDSTFKDFGTIKEGQLLEVSFPFRNSGDKNLIIENVSASCGCTVPEKPEEPFAPGKEGVIKARFDSRGKPGEQQKYITVITNTQQKEYTLSFKVRVSND